MASDDAVQFKARSCIKRVQEIHENLTQQRVVDIAVHDMQSLQYDGRCLSEIAKQQQENFNIKGEECKKRNEVQMKKKRDHEMEKRNKETEKRSLQAKRASLISERDHYQKELSDAQSTLSTAEGKLYHARKKLKKKKKKKKLVKIIGAVAGGITLGLPRVILGAGAAEVAMGLDDAEKHVENYRRDISNIEVRLRFANESLQSVESDLSSCEESIKQCKEAISQCAAQSDDLHEKIGSIKKSLAFINEAIYLWGIFENMSHNATEQTRHLEEIIRITQDTKEYEILMSDGVTKITATFLEAWERFVEHEAPPISC